MGAREGNGPVSDRRASPDPASNKHDPLGNLSQVHREVLTVRRIDGDPIRVHQKRVMVYEADQSGDQTHIDVGDTRGDLVVQTTPCERVLQDHQEILIDDHRHTQGPQIDVDLRHLLEADRVRPFTGDLVGNRFGARRERGLAECLDREQERREIIPRIGRPEGMDHEIDVRADIEVLRHDGDVGAPLAVFLGLLPAVAEQAGPHRSAIGTTDEECSK